MKEKLINSIENIKLSKEHKNLLAGVIGLLVINVGLLTIVLARQGLFQFNILETASQVLAASTSYPVVKETQSQPEEEKEEETEEIVEESEEIEEETPVSFPEKYSEYIELSENLFKPIEKDPVITNEPIVEEITVEEPKQEKNEIEEIVEEIQEPEMTCKDESTVSAQLLCFVNEKRGEENLEKFKVNYTLKSVAYTHSIWMDSKNKLTINEGDILLTDKCEDAGTSCSAVNVATSKKIIAEQVLETWLQDEKYSSNILGNYSEIGIGIHKNYITVVFK